MKRTELEIQASGQKCLDPVKIFVSQDMEDKLTPIDISIDFALLEETKETDPNVSFSKITIPKSFSDYDSEFYSFIGTSSHHE